MCKIITFGILLLSLTGCCQSKKIEGFWYGKYQEQNVSMPILYQFKDGNFIDYYGLPDDTLKYSCSFGSINIIDDRGRYNHLVGKLKGDTIKFYEKDSLVFEIQRTKSDEFYNDLYSENNLTISIPDGNGYTEAYGANDKHKFFFLFGYLGDQLAVHYNDTTVTCNADFFETFWNSSFLSAYRDNTYGSFTIVVDKNIKLGQLNELFICFRALSLYDVSLLLSIDDYGHANSLPIDLPDLNDAESDQFRAVFEAIKDKHNAKNKKTTSENEDEWSPDDPFKNSVIVSRPPDPPMPSLECLKKNGFLLISKANNSFQFNGDAIAREALKQKLVKAMSSDSRCDVFYHLSNNETVNDLVSVKSLIHEAYSVSLDSVIIHEYGVDISKPSVRKEMREVANNSRTYNVHSLALDEYNYLIEDHSSTNNVVDSVVKTTDDQVIDMYNKIERRCSEETFFITERMPKYSGGEQAVKEYLHIKSLELKGKVYIQFTIDCEGMVTEPKILRSLSPLADEAAIDLVKAMPQWTPGEQRGKKVNVSKTYAVVFD